MASPVHPAELSGPSSYPNSPRNRGRFGANFYCTCCFAAGQRQSRLLRDTYIYTYVHTETHPPPNLQHRRTNRVVRTINVAFANSTGGRFTTKVTEQTGQSCVTWVHSSEHEKGMRSISHSSHRRHNPPPKDVPRAQKYRPPPPQCWGGRVSPQNGSSTGVLPRPDASGTDQPSWHTENGPGRACPKQEPGGEPRSPVADSVETRPPQPQPLSGFFL